MKQIRLIKNKIIPVIDVKNLFFVIVCVKRQMSMIIIVKPKKDPHADVGKKEIRLFHRFNNNNIKNVTTTEII